MNNFGPYKPVWPRTDRTEERRLRAEVKRLRELIAHLEDQVEQAHGELADARQT